LNGWRGPVFQQLADAEITAMKNVKLQHIPVQNWLNCIFNLVGQRGIANENLEMKRIDCHISSRLTIKDPAIYPNGLTLPK
jgi:Fe-S cluster assembly scaffold protein SufB